MYNKALQLEMIARGDHKEIMNAILDEVHYSSFCIEAQIALVERGNPEEIKAYSEWRCFGDEAWVAINQFETELLNQGDHDKIIAWIAAFSLGEANEIMLVQRNNHEEIMAYIANYSLDSEGLVALIECGNHDEIMNYLDKHNYLDDKAQVALIRRNNAGEVKKSIRSGYFTCAEAMDMLKKLGYQKEINAYIAKKAKSAHLVPSADDNDCEPSDAPGQPDFECRVIPPDEDYPDD